MSAPVASTPGVAKPRSRIAELYHEHKRRDRSTGEDPPEEVLEWCAEPVVEAAKLEPQTAEDFAALMLLGFEFGEWPIISGAAVRHARRVLNTMEVRR